MNLEAENQRLRELLAEREAHCAEQEERLAEQKRQLAELAARADAAEEVARRLKTELELLRNEIQGPSSERFVDPNQLVLALPEVDAPEPSAPEPVDEEETPQGDEKKKKKKRKGRRKVEDMHHLPTVVHHEEHVPECPCGCGAPGVKVGEDVSWRLERVPAKVVRHRNIRDRFAFPDHDAQVGVPAAMWTAPAPVDYALPGALCGNELLVGVAIDKYCDHLPLYRQSQRFGREGLELSRSTLCDWMMSLGELLRPIVAVMATEVLVGSWMRVDATGMPVLDRSRTKGKAHQGQLWAWGNYDSVLFSYTPNKRGDTVAALFGDFRGVIVMDGASEFGLVTDHPDVTRAGCWAHARRYLYKALSTDRVVATRGLTAIRQLFLAERVVMAAAIDERVELRKELCQPVLDGLKVWVAEELPKQVPGGLMYKALRYIDNQWGRLVVFLEEPAIPCHNNATERDLRRPVKGKANYHFAGSPRGAKVAAIFYALIGTCLLQGMDPRQYLREVVGRLDEPARQLTPQAVRQQWLDRRAGS